MRPRRYQAEDLARLFRQRKVAAMPELKRALGTDADATVFRKLAELTCHTSYSHRGRFYTLDEIANFDHLGLWSFRSIWFSRFGTLVATVLELVTSSDAGYDAAELTSLLHVDCKQPLLNLWRAQRLARESLNGRLVYLSPQTADRRRQLSARRLLDAESPGLWQPAGVRVLPDELKAAIVLFHSLLDERQRRLYAGLEALKIGHGGDTQIAELLGMDPGTVAQGRRQLPSGEIDRERVRRAGGGRPSSEKKRQR